MKPHYDHLVVGGGISGMTAALLLARQGGRVLLLEKSPAIGGSMARFFLEGIPFDTGFHFTGGLADGGLVYDMLKVLGIEKQIQPVPFSKDAGNRFILESSETTHAFPYDRPGTIRALHDIFPDERTAIDTYFSKVDSVCDRTSSMDLRCLNESSHLLDEDYQSLTDVLNELTGNEELKCILSSYCLCYGVAPAEVSFANHARMCQGMHDGIVHVKNGGDAFVSAFKKALDTAGVDIQCNRYAVACEEVHERQVGAFRLNSGELVQFTNCVLTIHPQAILDLLPAENLRKAFVNRINSFESSFGFFAVFGVCDDPDGLDDCTLNIVPQCHLDPLLQPGHQPADSMLFCISGKEDIAGKPCRTLTALEAVCPEDLNEWADSSLMKRSQSYADYKAEKTERIVERIVAQLPQLKGSFRVLGSSTPLTFRDYLNSPDGSAYGVKQKVGQFNLFGQLPLRNLYAAGQSSVLPGVMGAMVSSFIVCRSILDHSEFDADINRRLDT